MIFYISLAKTEQYPKNSDKLELQAEKKPVKYSEVLKNLNLYKIALLYTFSRLFLVISIIYIPIWINQFPAQDIENIALIPLTFFIASFVVSFLLKYLNKNDSHKVR